MDNIFEQVSKGNKYKITVNQHIIPVESIKRFTNTNNKVNIKNLISKNKKVVQVNPKDSIFTVKRFWSEIDEAGYMKIIEDNFQKLIDKIINKDLLEFSFTENQIIWKMYLLWMYRVEFFGKYQQINSFNIKTDSVYTQLEKEKIESIGMSYHDNGYIPSRFIIGGQIQLAIMGDISLYKNIKWKIIFSKNINFIMPSNPYMNSKDTDNLILYFPISSNICLLPYNEFKVSTDFVNDLNTLMKQNSKWFYFWE
ncbi:DUF4238 domain-containing protein [Halarcobacter sp.]|uniref:DUF4238 domain-containing protein n=1 Tax=Halarcobacter sp. TaxID=2321133 RepID=UPI003A92809F